MSGYVDACALVELALDTRPSKNRGADVIDALLRRPEVLAELAALARARRAHPSAFGAHER